MTRSRLILAVLVSLALSWAVVVLVPRAAGAEPECPAATTTTVPDLPCGFTDGVPVGCYDPQPGDACYVAPAAPPPVAPAGPPEPASPVPAPARFAG